MLLISLKALLLVFNSTTRSTAAAEVETSVDGSISSDRKIPSDVLESDRNLYKRKDPRDPG